MTAKRLLAMFLILITVFAILVSCGNTEKPDVSDTSQESSQVDESSEDPNVDRNPLEHIPEQNLDREIVFLVEGDYRKGYMSIEIVDYEGTSIQSYVRERNLMVEEHLGITITEIRTDVSTDMMNMIRNAANLSEPFDIAMPYMVDIAPAIGEGIAYDLKEFSDIIRFDQPYWDQNANNSLSVKEKLYFTTGDFSLLSMDVTHCMIFNRTLVSALGLEDPYELVSQGKWTMDKMLEMAASLTEDIDGDDAITWKDKIGAFINSNYANSLYIGAGESFARKDSDDIPYISLMSSTATNVFDKIYDVFQSKDVIRTESFHEAALAEGFSSCYYAARESLANDRALFVAIALSDIMDMSNYDNASFGLLVTPKFSEEQENYHSYISVIFATSCMIPSALSEEDAQISALVLEALTATSTDTVKKNYYERVIKLQKIQDEEGEKMLDFIFNNRVYDIGAIYNFGGIRDFVSNETQKASNVFISSYDSNKGAMETALEKLLNDLG